LETRDKGKERSIVKDITRKGGPFNHLLSEVKCITIWLLGILRLFGHGLPLKILNAATT
jgi:hypothetical protein